MINALKFQKFILNKMLVIRARIHKMLDRIANRYVLFVLAFLTVHWL